MHTYTNTHLVNVKLGQHEPAIALLRWKERKERWLWRVKVGRFRGHILLCFHITALHSRGYGAWLHTAASIMFMQTLCQVILKKWHKRVWFHLMYYLKPIRRYLVFTPNQIVKCCAVFDLKQCCDGAVSVHGAEIYSNRYFSHTGGAHCKNTGRTAAYTQCQDQSSQLSILAC